MIYILSVLFSLLNYTVNKHTDTNRNTPCVHLSASHIKQRKKVQLKYVMLVALRLGGNYLCNDNLPCRLNGVSIARDPNTISNAKFQKRI